MRKFYFTPGPSQLYFTVEEHIKKALNEQIPSISHRSERFKAIYANTVNQLKQLLNLNDDHQILFTSSATEIWERIGQNMVDQQSFHFVNGAFSSRFQQTLTQLGKNALYKEAKIGEVVDVEKVLIPEATELIALTQNETSTGAAMTLESIYKIREAFPDQLLAIDVVSSAPTIDLDYNQVDCAYFSVQKCFGLPSGLGVWVVNRRCVDKCEEILNQGKRIGSYHSLPVMLEKALKNQTPETPNVLNIYLLGKVAEDMLTKGIKQIRQEAEYKAAVMYQVFEQCQYLAPLVSNATNRSKTTLVADCNIDSHKIINNFAQLGIELGTGYGSNSHNHLRIANFPTHSKEHIEMIADRLIDLKF